MPQGYFVIYSLVCSYAILTPFRGLCLLARLDLLRKLGFLCGSGLFLLAVTAGAQSFRNPPMISTAFDPATIATADFNGDGIPDLVYDTPSVNGSGTTLHVLLGKGDGTYADVQDSGLPGPLGGQINLADVNGDGKLDLILGGGGVSTGAGVVAVLPGNGDGTFGAPVVSTFSPAGAGVYVATGTKMGIGDINGDGAIDLVIPDPANTALYVLLGNKAGQFQYVGKVYNGSYPTEAFLADLNGDGHWTWWLSGRPEEAQPFTWGMATPHSPQVSSTTLFREQRICCSPIWTAMGTSTSWRKERR